MEEHVGAQLGPTLRCIIGLTFERLKRGDRFFYRHDEAGFTKEQIAEIDRYSLASVLCDTVLDRAFEIQKYALLQTGT